MSELLREEGLSEERLLDLLDPVPEPFHRAVARSALAGLAAAPAWGLVSVLLYAGNDMGWLGSLEALRLFLAAGAAGAVIGGGIGLCEAVLPGLGRWRWPLAGLALLALPFFAEVGFGWVQGLLGGTGVRDQYGAVRDVWESLRSAPGWALASLSQTWIAGGVLVLLRWRRAPLLAQAAGTLAALLTHGLFAEVLVQRQHNLRGWDWSSWTFTARWLGISLLGWLATVLALALIERACDRWWPVVRAP